MFFHPGRIIFAVCLAVALAAPVCSTAASEHLGSRVLILNSYHPGYHWSDDVMQGALQALREALPSVDPCVEFMDGKRHPDPEQMEIVRRYLAAKYRERPKDLVLALDNAALELVLAHREELFPGAAVVFAGVNGFRPEMLAGQERVTGVAEIHDYAGTLELALSLHPQTREVLIVHDYTATGLGMRREMEGLLERFQGRVKLTFAPPATFAEARGMLHAMPPHGLGMLLDFATDRQGTSLPVPQSTAALTAGLSTPVYNVFASRLGHGVAGGMMLSAGEHGRRAGKMAAEIISGRDPAAIPVDASGGARPMFDHQVMLRLGIAEDRLPPDSLVVNRIPSFYQRHRELLLVMALVTVLMGAAIVVLAANIVLRRKAQAELSESERRFRGVFEQAAVGICYATPEGRFLRANSTLCRILGHDEGELTAMNFRQLSLPEELAREEPLMADLLAGRIGQYAMEKRFRRRDGETVWTRVAVSVLRDAAGRPVSLVGVVEDIGQRKRAELELAELAAIVASSSEAMIGVDPQGVITSWNQGARRLYGYAEDEAVGRHVSMLIPAGHADREMAHFQRALRGEPIAQYETLRLTKDGRLVEVSLSISPIRNGGETTVRVSVIARDISARRRAEAALRDSEDRYRTLFAMSPFAVFVHINEEIILVNPAGVALLGMARGEDLIGCNLIDGFIHPEDRDLARRRGVEIVASGRVAPHGEYRLARPSGEVVHVGATGQAVTLAGRQAILTIYWDITQRKQAEQEKEALETQLRQSQKMEAMGALAGGIAHDFNNVLAAIMGYGELALEQMREGGDASSEVGQMLRAARRARDLVRQILTFSRKSAGEPRPLDLNREIRQSLNLLGSTLPKMIRIVTHLDDGLWLVNADRTQMQQVILNLATNAADAMSAGGQLTFATSNVRVEAQKAARHLGFEPGDYALLTVSDDGCGMDEKVVAQIFDPFFTTKAAGKGTGLGLSTVYGIVKGHRGHVSCSSQPGRGTVFRLYFPALPLEKAEPLPQPEHAPAPQARWEGRGRLVLVVDDEAPVREVASRILGHAGFRAEQAGSGEEALELCARERVDLVVLDLSMPGMGGVKCLEEIKRRHPGTAVLVATGYARMGLSGPTLRLAEGFMNKPFTRADLLARVMDILG